MTDPTDTTGSAAAAEATVRRFLGMLHDPVQPDLAEAMRDFADDVVYQSLVPSREPIRGRARIRRELEQQFARYTECDCEILALAATGRHVFTERRDHVTMTGRDRRIFSSVNAVFDLDAQGRIVAWREYWDTGDIARQLDMTAEELWAMHAPESSP